MTEADYADYIARFNANDFEGLGRFYCEDVVYSLGEKRQIVGRDNILAFYRDLKSKVREARDVVGVATGPGTLACHVRTEFFGLADWPDFIAGPLMKGETLNIESLGFYYLRGGKFARIISARYMTLPIIPASA